MPASIFNGNAVKILKNILRFKTTGEIGWDANSGCPYYPSDVPNVTNQIGQETHIRVYNGTAGTLLNGSNVYSMGVDPDNTHPSVELAIANNYAKSRVIGTVTADILPGDHGIITREGLVNGLDTSLLTTGNILYLSPTTLGGYSTTPPNDGNFQVTVGIAVKIDATQGSILVFHDANDYTTETTQKTGWSNSYGPCTLSFVDGVLGATRTLTLTPVIGGQFHFYQDGLKYEKTTDSIQISDVEGLHIIYYNLGVLVDLANPTNSQIDSVIRNNVTVAYVGWDFVNRTAIYIGKEQHDMQFPSIVHSYNHFSYGARYLTGLGPNSIIAEGNGSLDSHAQFGVDAGAITDEDIYLPTSSIGSTVGLPIFYLAGTTAAPTLRKTSKAGFSILTAGTGRIAYNFLTGGNWTIAEATNNFFVLCHVFCINENDINKRVIAFLGQAQYSSVALARAGASSEIVALKINGILPQEIKSIATFVFETRDSYTNSVNARIREISAGVSYEDWRSVNNTGGSVAGGSTTNVFSDNSFQIYDDLDATKTMQFQVSALTTGTNRIATIPDRSFTMGDMSAWITATNYSSTSVVNYTDNKIYKSTVAHTSGVFATDLAAGKWVELSRVGTIPLSWVNDSEYAAIEDTVTLGILRYGFIDQESNLIKTSFVVPSNYIINTPIIMELKIHSPTGSNNILMTTKSTLIKTGTEALTSIVNQRTSINTAVTILGVNYETIVTTDLTFTDGTINSVAVAAGDTILVSLFRGAGSNTDTSWVIPSHTGVLI